MIFRVIVEGEIGERLKDVFQRAGWIHSDSGDVDLVISRKPDPLVRTVLIDGGDITDNVIDVLRGDETPEELILKAKLYEAYLNSGDIESLLEEEFVRSKRYSIPLSVVIFRILDSDTDVMRCLFKSIRDYGRISDKVYRVSDSDVLVVLVGTDESGIDVFVRRIKRRFKREYLKLKVLKIPDVYYAKATLEDWMLSGEDLLASAEYDLVKNSRRM